MSLDQYERSTLKIVSLIRRMNMLNFGYDGTKNVKDWQKYEQNFDTIRAYNDNANKRDFDRVLLSSVGRPKGKMNDMSSRISKKQKANVSNAEISKEIKQKFLGTVRFGNDHVAAILGFGDLQWGNILIIRVYFVEGLGHNLFSVGQFCDSDLEVAFRRNTCFVRTLEGVDLLKGNRSTNLYTINLYEMDSDPQFASWLVEQLLQSHGVGLQRLSHLNFDSINNLAKNDLVIGLPKFKYHKEHLCSSCEQGKSKWRVSITPKQFQILEEVYTFFIWICCGQCNSELLAINGKRYVLVIVDITSCYTWVLFLDQR
ncbi:retrovirus-related pol polyprotein from transposon TNT 1-94 [Tanacetum coccineum]|uniref:Retrovirus-related pol polyprotein from transposon TNT 1-94 n=1 Tax=Tanacetum coccineum TaxID=301880 RepID=A0ABQ4ZMQ9_9ASTR